MWSGRARRRLSLLAFDSENLLQKSSLEFSGVRDKPETCRVRFSPITLIDEDLGIGAELLPGIVGPSDILVGILFQAADRAATDPLARVAISSTGFHDSAILDGRRGPDSAVAACCPESVQGGRPWVARFRSCGSSPASTPRSPYSGPVLTLGRQCVYATFAQVVQMLREEAWSRGRCRPGSRSGPICPAGATVRTPP